jgi:hypothetical protein
VPENVQPAAGASAEGVQAADVAAATHLLQSLGIHVGAHATTQVAERPSNLGLKLPVFKGDPDRSGRIASYAVQDFLDRLDAFFSCSAGQYANDHSKLLSLLNCFPFGSPAATWWASLKGTIFTLDEFRTVFRAKYGFDQRDAHYIIEKFNSFKQRDNDSVVANHTNFTQLVTEMSLVLQAQDVPSTTTQRARFINGLRNDIKTLVLRTVTHHPAMTLHDVMQEAILEERQLPRQKTRLNAMNVPPASEKRRTSWRCAFCRSNAHAWESCERIAQKKRDGTWEERPPRRAN